MFIRHRCVRSDLADHIFQGLGFVRVVREELDGPHTHLPEHTKAVLVVARVNGQAQPQVRVHGVETLVLQIVCPDLVRQANASPLVTSNVDEDAQPVLVHDSQELVQLLAAITALRAEDVACEAR